MFITPALFKGGKNRQNEKPGLPFALAVRAFVVPARHDILALGGIRHGNELLCVIELFRIAHSQFVL
jgi:hypothetical protein